MYTQCPNCDSIDSAVNCNGNIICDDCSCILYDVTINDFEFSILDYIYYSDFVEDDDMLIDEG